VPPIGDDGQQDVIALLHLAGTGFDRSDPAREVLLIVLEGRAASAVINCRSPPRMRGRVIWLRKSAFCTTSATERNIIIKSATLMKAAKQVTGL
jgi:hypothetical protein